MSDEDLKKLKSYIKENNIDSTVVLNVLGGAIPYIGGILPAIAARNSNKKSDEILSIIVELFSQVSKDIESIKRELVKTEQPRTKINLLTFLMDLFDEEFVERLLLSKRGYIMINPITREEFQEYISDGLVVLNSTYSSANMGAGCRCGDHVEERKRAYGMGMGFEIILNI